MLLAKSWLVQCCCYQVNLCCGLLFSALLADAWLPIGQAYLPRGLFTFLASTLQYWVPDGLVLSSHPITSHNYPSGYCIFILHCSRSVFNCCKQHVSAKRLHVQHCPTPCKPESSCSRLLLPHLHDVLQRILGSKYDAQRLSALQRYSHRCAITGISKSAMPLQVVPQWVFNRHKRPNKCVELFGPHHAVDWEGDSHGLMAICEPLARVKQAADNGLSTASREDLQAVISMLMAVNSWAQQDAETYIQFAEQRRQELQLDNWACAAA